MIADFSSNSLRVQVSGTTAAWFVPFSFGRGGLPFTVGATHFPPQPGLQVKELRIEAVDAVTRLVHVSVANALCAQWEDWLRQRLSSPLPASAVAAGCPTIDATVRYVHSAAGWRPEHVVRDAFPTLSIVRMKADRALEIYHQSPEGPASRALLLLAGIDRLIYDIQQKQDELSNDLAQSSCALQ